MADNVDIIVQDTINDIVVNTAVVVETIDINVQVAVDEVTIISNPNEYIINVNRIIGEQVQSDWNETDDQAPDYIKNKPIIPSIDGLATIIYVDEQDALKVDKEIGKGLSTNDYTTTEKNKLEGIEAGAEVNVNADWNATSGDAEILNKPTIPSIDGLATVIYVDQQDALKVDKEIGKGLSTNDFTNTLKTKLDGIQEGAEVNVNADWNATFGDAEILNKPTIPSIDGLATIIYVNEQDALKVDKEIGKGLSSNDFTNTLKTKLDGIQEGAEVNVNADWNATSGDAEILNKPTIPVPVTNTSDLINDGEDGINPFITLNDIPPVTGFVPYTGATQGVNLGEFGVQLGNIEFDNTPTNIPTTAGSVVWNDSDGTLNLILKGGNVTLQVGQEQVLRVVNKTATNVNLLESNYQAVRVTGAQGQRLKVDLAQATNDILSAETIGLVTETINNNQEGFITTSGLVRGINTTGSIQGETWVDGDIIYLSPFTAGLVTKVKPTAPNHLIIIGYVVHAHITQGTIFVKVDNGYELDELHNVKITGTPANNNLLAYTSADSIWENKTIENVLGYTPENVNNKSTLTTLGTSDTLYPTQNAVKVYADTKFTLPALTNGSILFSNGTTIAQDNANLFWDDSNNRLGIGTTNPLKILTTSNTDSNVGFSNARTSVIRVNNTSTTIGSFSGIAFGRNNTNTQTTAMIGEILQDTSSTWASDMVFGVKSSIIATDVSEYMRIKYGGNVGIGTANPEVKLDVYGSGTVQSRIQSASGGDIRFSVDTFGRVGTYSASDLALLTSGTEKVRITTAGNVGIGTTNPSTKLDVNGVITATGGNSTSWNAKQDAITLTTTGTSGAATLVGSTLNIPQYSGGSGSGVHAQRIIKSGEYANLYLNYSSAPITGTVIQNRLYMMPFFPNQTITTQSLSINVTTLFAGGLAKILIFSDVDGSPTTKLYESADFDCSTIGIKTSTTSFTFTAGTTYWISIVSNNGINQFTFIPQASVYAFTGAASFNGFTHNYISVTYNAVPSTITLFTGQGGNIPMVAIRKA